MRDYEVRSGDAAPRAGGKPERRRGRISGLIALGALGGVVAVGSAAASSLTRPAAASPSGRSARHAVLAAARSGCGAAPPAVLLASAFGPTPSPSPSASPSPTATPPPIDPGPPASQAPTPSPSTSTPTSSSPTPPAINPGPPARRAPAPSKTPTKKPTPPPTKKPTPPPGGRKHRNGGSTTAQLCASVQPFSNQIRPGHTASYAVLVWSSGRPSGPASVRIQGSSAFDATAPRFNGCGGGSACPVGGLSLSRADELTVSASVGNQALGGERLGLTATVSAAGAFSGSASATIAVVTPSVSNPTGLLSNTALELGSAGGDFPPLLNLPGVTPVNPTTLFPTVSPGSGSGGANGHARPGHRPRHIDAANTAAVVPIGALTLGGQVIGLVVLVGALALAFIRFSLRAPRPSSQGKPL